MSLGESLRFCYFFFSSRRRHTRSLCDWSSDVCSSDLGDQHRRAVGGGRCGDLGRDRGAVPVRLGPGGGQARRAEPDRKSTRLNSSHTVISYAVFCLKKKKKHKENNQMSTT